MPTGILAMTAALTISCSGAAMALQPQSELLSAADQIVESLVYGNGAAAFRIPEDGILPEKLTIRISGRAVYEDGFSMSLHYLEEENGAWKPDTIYYIPLDGAGNDRQLYGSERRNDGTKRGSSGRGSAGGSVRRLTG